MKLKERILTAIADKLKDYVTPEYDILLSCYVKAEVKGAFMTMDCTTIKELTNKNKSGIINIADILDEELGDDRHYKEIIFCDNENVVCLHNSKNDTYYESVHEYFDSAEEKVYIKLGNNDYESVKNFINQSSKYHGFVKYNNEIPDRKAFNKIFMKKEETTSNELKDNKIQKDYENNVEITGQLFKIGKEFTKKDGSKARFIEIQQKYNYNGKVKYNNISAMAPSDLINSITDMKLNNTISIKGKLNTYNDKNNNLKSVINCIELNILKKAKNKEKLEK